MAGTFQNVPSLAFSTVDIEADNIDATGDLAVGGNADITGNITGADATLSGDLGADNADIAADLDVGGNAAITGTLGAAATTVTTLHATGAATLDSTLGAGATTVTTLHATGAATLDSTLAAGATSVTTLAASSTSALTGNVTLSNDLICNVAGKGVKIKEGSNARMGVATLVAGTVEVANTSVTANTRIFLSAQNDSADAGYLWVSARSASTSFTILSSEAADDRIVAWLLIEPA